MLAIVFNLNKKRFCQKFGFILNIFLEKQFFFFNYFYLYFFYRIFLSFISNQFITIFSDFILAFCQNFKFSLLVNGLSRFDKKVFSSRCIFLLLKLSIKKKKFLILKKTNFFFNYLKFIKNSQNKPRPVLDIKDFYLKKTLNFGKFIHSSPFLYRKKTRNLYKIFKDFSFTMLRLFKFKVLFFIFFRFYKFLFKEKIIISFFRLRSLPKSIIAGKMFIRNNKRMLYKIKYFLSKYKTKVKFVLTLSTKSSRNLNNGIYFRNISSYFLAKFCDKLYFNKKLYILTTGRSLVYRFSKRLEVPLPYKYTKYKFIQNNILESKWRSIFNSRYLILKKKISYLLSRSDFTKNYKSSNYFIKKPIQKLIVSGRKKLGFNIYNNLFLVMHKVFRGSALQHIEVVNNVYKRLFIRATIRNIERNFSALGVKQSCSILMGYEELKSRVNLFFFDYISSLCRKKTKVFRTRKVKDLIFSEFFRFSLKNYEIKETTHLMSTFINIYEFMFKELNFRNAFRPFRARFINLPRFRKKFIFFNRFKKILYRKFKYAIKRSKGKVLFYYGQFTKFGNHFVKKSKFYTRPYFKLDIYENFKKIFKFNLNIKVKKNKDIYFFSNKKFRNKFIFRFIKCLFRATHSKKIRLFYYYKFSFDLINVLKEKIKRFNYKRFFINKMFCVQLRFRARLRKRFFSFYKIYKNIVFKFTYKFFKDMRKEVFLRSTVDYRIRRALKLNKKNPQFLRIKEKKRKVKKKLKYKLNQMFLPTKFKFTSHSRVKRLLFIKKFKFFLFDRKLRKKTKKQRKKYFRSKRYFIFKIKRKKFWNDFRKVFRKFNPKNKKIKLFQKLKKFLKIELKKYSANMLYTALNNHVFLFTNKLFNVRCGSFLNKIFLFKHIGNFRYNIKFSRFSNFKSLCKLGGSFLPIDIMRSFNLYRSKHFFYKYRKDKVYYSAKKYVNKFLFLKLSVINKFNFFFINFSKLKSKRFFNTIREILKKHSFFKFMIYNKFKIVSLKKNLKNYINFLNFRFLNTKRKVFCFFIQKYLSYICNFNNI